MTIEEIQAKGGEAYSEKGRRNPIRRDTNDLLTALVLAKQPQMVLEIGTAYGVSTLCIAAGLPKQGKIHTYELSEEVAAEAQDTFRSQEVNATVHAGVFENVYQSQGEIDLVFLDHEKGRYLADFKRIEADLAPGALILADNVLDRQAECQDFLDYIRIGYRFTIIPTECGLLVATR